MAGSVQPRQLAFALPHEESLSRDDFLEGPSNAQALALVENWPDWPNRIMMMVGPEGCGKSHLAAIWAAEAGARTMTAHSLTTATVPGALATGALVTLAATGVFRASERRAKDRGLLDRTTGS